MIGIKTRTGMPSAAVRIKKFEYPTLSTSTPEKPARNFGRISMMEEKTAYCVAEYCTFVSPDR